MTLKRSEAFDNLSTLHPNQGKFNFNFDLNTPRNQGNFNFNFGLNTPRNQGNFIFDFNTPPNQGNFHPVIPNNLQFNGFGTQIQGNFHPVIPIEFKTQNLNNTNENSLDTFIINVNNRKYVCNQYAVNSSEVIREFREKNPLSKEYEYNFDGPTDFFDIICDFFNFKKINISAENKESLRIISENLKINQLLSKIEKFCDTYDEMIQKVNPIEEVFDWLYHIKELTVDSVKKSIMDSPLSHSEDNIKELAAIFLQVIRSGYKNHPFLIDLLISLDKSSKKTDDLNLLLPFIIKQTINFLDKNKSYCGFAYKLYQKGIISIEQIIKIISNEKEQKSNNCNPIDWITSTSNDQNYNISLLFTNIATWFLPELLENKIVVQTNNQQINYIIKNNQMDKYKRMRDTLEPEDELCRAIYFDDIDSFQEIVSKCGIDINFKKIKPSIFDNFPFLDKSLLDYSAECGSIKCFKYLLLNHAKIEQKTLAFAILGGNVEIIRTIDQQNLCVYFTNMQNGNQNDNNILNSTNIMNPILITIILHQYNLFDWIVDEKIEHDKINNSILTNLAQISAAHGNIHSFLYCIDNGLTISNNTDLISDMIKSASYSGYLRLNELILSYLSININLPNNRSNSLPQHQLSDFEDATANFGNLSILKLFIGFQNYNFKKALDTAINYDYNDIFQYLINNFYHLQTKNDVFDIMSQSIRKNSSAIFTTIMNIYGSVYLKHNDDNDIHQLYDLCSMSCLKGNCEITRKLIDLIIESQKNTTCNMNMNMNELFFNACKSGSLELCEYLMENKNLFYFEEIIAQYDKIFDSNSRIALKLLDKFGLDLKMPLMRLLFNESINKNNNKEIFEMFLEQNLDNNQILIGAVGFRDIELVNKVLSYNSKPLIINQNSKNGTALCIAAKNNDLEIVNKLLSLPGIDTTLCDEKGLTPFMISVKQMNLQIMSAFIDYYGENIQEQFWQLQQSINVLNYYYLKNKNMKFSSKIEEKLVFILNGFLQINPDISFNNDFLYCACQRNSFKVVAELLKAKNINVNMHDLKNGDTPLIEAIKNKNADIAHLLINFPKTNINLARYDTNTALTIASLIGLDDIVSDLVNHPSFDPQMSNINLAFFFSKKDSLNTILYQIKDLDVNYQVNPIILKKSDENFHQNMLKFGPIQNIHVNDDPWEHIIRKDLINDSQNNRNNLIHNNMGFVAGGGFGNNVNTGVRSVSSIETTLTYAVKNYYLKKVEMILSHPSFNESKSRLKQALFIESIGNTLLFNTLYNFVKDPAITSETGVSLFDYLLQKKQFNLVKMIFNCSQANISKDNILYFYHKLSSNEYPDLLRCLIQYDKEHNHYIDLNDTSAMDDLIGILK